MNTTLMRLIGHFFPAAIAIAIDTSTYILLYTTALLRSLVIVIPSQRSWPNKEHNYFCNFLYDDNIRTNGTT